MALSNHNIDSDLTVDSRGLGDITRNVTGITSIGVYAPNIETIQGQMITATLELDEMQQVAMDDIDIKSRLLNALAIELLSAKCIEFTKQQDVATNTTKVRARIYATPDSQVRIIRQATK